MKQKDLLAALLILAVLVLVFFDLFTLKSAFLSGDHRDQQYPWAAFYQHEIHAGRLPWWTSQIHCGFPLLAEGQIGAFYPLNFLFFYFLPMKFAYNYLVLFQYFLGGLLFTFYLIRHGISRWGSFFACLIYLFGSTQGGYFYYNYISQKVVIWLPLTLLLIDRLFEKQKPADAFWLACVFAVQIFGGYLQVAIYSILFSAVYFCWLFVFSSRRVRPLLLFFSAGTLGIFFSLVQLLPTLELARLSSRAEALPGLAYVGSMLPLGFLTLVYPSWDGFLGSEWYLGLAGLFFSCFALSAKKGSMERFFIFSAAFFLLLALGKYSPLYRLIIEVTGFQGFRTPIKFLFFVSFSCAVLAGFGFDHFFAPASSPAGKAVYLKFFAKTAYFFLLLPPVAFAVLLGFRSKFLPFFQGFVVHQFFGKAGHPHSAEAYSERAAGFYDFMIQTFSFSNRNTMTAWVLLALLPVLLSLILKMGAGSRAKAIVTLFLLLDLFLYGFTSIRPNLEPYTSVNSGKGKIVDYLISRPRPFRVGGVSGPSGDILNLPFYPNSNMLYGLDEIGAYSPLVMKSYRDFFDSWAYVNDSLSAALPSSGSVLGHLKELAFLNVEYLISRFPLKSPALELILEEKGNKLYHLKNVLPRAYFIPAGSAAISFAALPLDKIQPASVTADNPQQIEISVDAPQSGTVFLSEVNYPNWTAVVNDKPVQIHTAGKLFRAVEVSKGQNRILMRYDPVLYKRLGLSALAVFIVLGGFFMLHAVRRKKETKTAVC